MPNSDIQVVVSAKDEATAVLTGFRKNWLKITAAITAGFYAVDKIMEHYAGFNKEIAKAGANVNATAKQMEEMRRVAIKAAEGTSVSATEAANALSFLAGGSVSAKDAMAVLSDTVDFATANQIDLREATLLTSQVMSVFKMRGEEVTKVMDTVTKAGQISYATTGQLSQALQEAAPVAAQVGINFTDLTAIISAMADTGTLGTEAGVALKRAINELITPSKSAKEALKLLNLNFNDIKKLLPDPIKLLKTLEERLTTYKDPIDKAAILSRIFGDVSGPKMAALLQLGTDAMDNYVDSLTDVEGTMKKASDTIKNAESPTLRIKEAFEKIGFTIAENLGPTVARFSEDFAELIDEIFWITNSNLPPLSDALVVQTKSWYNVKNATEDANKCYAESTSKIKEQSNAVNNLGFDIDKYTDSLKEAEQAAEKAWKDQVDSVKELRKEVEDLNEKIFESTKKYNEDAADSQGAYYSSIAKMVSTAESEIIDLRKQRDEAILEQDKKEIVKLDEKISKQQAIINTYQNWNLGIEKEVNEQRRYLAMNELERLKYDYELKTAMRHKEFLEERIELQKRLNAKQEVLNQATIMIGQEKMVAINAEIEKTKTFKEKLIEKTQSLKNWVEEQKRVYSGYVSSINSKLASIRMPAFAGGYLQSYQQGTSYVPTTGAYLLHKGESVIPAGKGVGGITVNILGGTYLSRDVAEEIGNMIIKTLKLNMRI